MRQLFLVLCSVLFISWIGAQDVGISVRGNAEGALPDWSGDHLSYYLKLKDGAAWPLTRIRFYNQRGSTEWMTLVPDIHADGEKISTLGFLSEKAYEHFALEWPTGVEGELHFFDPGVSSETPPITRPLAVEESACFCTLPSVVERESWCPDGKCPLNPNPTATTVTHLIVHHSAGTNVSNDWASVVRSIWNFHVVGNGWSDVGYNYLVDPNGVIYEGRGNDVLGAHFCGNNTGTMGTCMLGDFTEITPTDTAMASLAKLLAWKACENSLFTTGTTFHSSSAKFLPTISGHRDGCATSCPGNAFYPMLADFPEAVDDTLTACLPVAVSVEEPAFPEWAISPNPGNGWVRMTGIDGMVEYAVFDLSGRVVNRGSAAEGDFIEAVPMKAARGMYTVVIQRDGEQGIKRLIIQ